ncbi:HprK-related kinase A [Ningiella sp. W23]|uniref:HprK-related kinase A n=1 Tax=Ningiella sp. W23 TaxID=3023715 RepID=UPI003756E5AB
MKSKTFQLDLSPFRFQIITDIDLVLDNAKRIYQQKFIDGDLSCHYIDYQLSVMKSGGVRSFYKPQARFFCDTREPFKPLNHNQGFAMLEWGMNWTVAAHELQHVIIHSAVLEKNGKAIIFPAPPGSGKSTLTAYLANNGWRLLSDEMALIIPFSDIVVPFVRPICLKNQSIDIAKTWFPSGVFSSVAKDTHKGDVIHLAPKPEHFEQAGIQAKIVGVVFPRFQAGTALEIYQLDMMEAFTKLAENAFNFTAIGKDGFDTVTQLIEEIAKFEICYSQLDEVVDFLLEEII